MRQRLSEVVIIITTKLRKIYQICFTIENKSNY